MRGFSQDRLAEVIGIDQKHMSRIELGKSYPSLDRLVRIAEALQVSLPSLFEFMHLETPEVQARSIEEMVKALDEESRRKAYQVIRAVLKEM
jgi:transcriptional regulator with XRE-family HTH domain